MGSLKNALPPHLPTPPPLFPTNGVRRGVNLTTVGTRLFFTRPERDNQDTAKSAVISSLFHLALIIAIIVLTRAGVMLVTGDQGVGTGIGTGAAGGGGGGGRDDVISIVVSEP